MNSSFFTVGIGYSAGGLPAVETFFRHLPADTGAVFVVIHHMLRSYKSQLKNILDKHTLMPVHSIQDSMDILPDHVYVLDENEYVKIWDNHLYFTRRPPDTEVNFAIDTFFLSLAREKKDKAVGIIFSGTGSDGAKGGHAIHASGGELLVQDPSSASFQFMPINAIKNDHPYSVATPGQLAGNLLELISVKKKHLTVFQDFITVYLVLPEIKERMHLFRAFNQDYFTIP